MSTYLLMDADGNVEEVLRGSLPRVVADLQHSLPRHSTVIFDGDLREAMGGGGSRLANPLPKGLFRGAEYQGPDEEMPRYAQEACGLKISHAQVMAMTDADASARLRVFFVTEKGEQKGGYKTVRTIGSHVLTKNFKTEKAKGGKLVYDPEETEDPLLSAAVRVLPASFSKGLALLPYTQAAAYARTEGLRRNLPLFTPDGLTSYGLCVGSTDACRQSCLVHSGQNEVVESNKTAKGQRTEALMREPVAFMKAVHYSISTFAKNQKKLGVRPYIRMNIYSDIPWELSYPELFSSHPDVQFYDYTKVAGRDVRHIPNYHLTYSYAGTETSKERMRREFARGMQVTLVFNLPRNQGFDGLTMDGHKVYDGDQHDIRTFEKSPAVIGLRYKPPMPKIRGREKELGRAGLVVPGQHYSEAELAEMKSARSEAAAIGKVRRSARAEHLSREHFLVQVEKDASTGLFIMACTPRLLGGDDFADGLELEDAEEEAEGEGKEAETPKGPVKGRGKPEPKPRASKARLANPVLDDDTLS
jgi:hypothetical protein